MLLGECAPLRGESSSLAVLAPGIRVLGVRAAGVRVPGVRDLGVCTQRVKAGRLKGGLVPSRKEWNRGYELKLDVNAAYQASVSCRVVSDDATKPVHLQLYAQNQCHHL